MNQSCAYLQKRVIRKQEIRCDWCTETRVPAHRACSLRRDILNPTQFAEMGRTVARFNCLNKSSICKTAINNYISASNIKDGMGDSSSHLSPCSRSARNPRVRMTRSNGRGSTDSSRLNTCVCSFRQGLPSMSDQTTGY